jgi:hypothetical protein
MQTIKWPDLPGFGRVASTHPLQGLLLYNEDLNENIKSVNYVIFGKSDVATKLKPNNSKRKRSKSPKQDKIKKPLAQLDE